MWIGLLYKNTTSPFFLMQWHAYLFLENFKFYFDIFLITLIFSEFFVMARTWRL